MGVTMALKGPIAVLLVAALSGCAVARLATGVDAPDRSALRPGISKTEAEVLLGEPQRSWKTDRGIEYAVYRIYIGAKPQPGLAALTFIIDVGLAGMMEIFAAMAESRCKDLHPEEDLKYQECVGRFYESEPVNLLVSYDAQGTVLGLFNEFDELPPDGRSSKRPSSLLGEKDEPR